MRSCSQQQIREMSDQVIATPTEKKITILAYAPWIVVAIGITLRLAQYGLNRSLWLDEAFLALNIVNRSFPELLKPLDYGQVAPVGFLLMERLNVQLFGDNEYALRLFPLIAGVSSLFLFYYVAKRLLKKGAVIIAVILFALSSTLIYYSSEVKQYSSDAMIALLLYVMALHIHSKKWSGLHGFLYGAAGAIAVWFSNPSVFVLAGIGLTILLWCLTKKEWPDIGRLSIIFSLWLLSFITFYISIISQLNKSGIVSNMQREWRNSFIPIPPSSFSDLQWYIDNFFNIVSNPAGIFLSSMATFIFLIGCISMFIKDKQVFFILLSPLMITLLASGCHMYPFTGRFLLFLVPSLLLLVAEGVEYIRDKTRPTSPAIGGLIIGLLLFHPIVSAINHTITLKPYTTMPNEDIKTVLHYLNDHKRKGDVVYIYYASQFAFRYYDKRYGAPGSEYITGIMSRDNWRGYIEDLNKLGGKGRVWLVFSHVHQSSGVDEEKLFIYHLDSIGTRLDCFKSDGAAIYLYDLSKAV